MNGVATSSPNVRRKFTAGGIKTRYPNAAPAKNARKLIGNRAYKYLRALGFNAGATNITTWKRKKGSTLKSYDNSRQSKASSQIHR